MNTREPYRARGEHTIARTMREVNFHIEREGEAGRERGSETYRAEAFVDFRKLSEKSVLKSNRFKVGAKTGDQDAGVKTGGQWQA